MKHRRGPWRWSETEMVRRFYADVPTAMLAEEIGRTPSQVYQKAAELGLRKSAAFMASDHSGRVQRGKQDPRMRATQFKPGLVPWNKGTHYVAGGRSAETRFKKGRPARAAHNYRAIGSEKVDPKRGVLMRKMTDDPTLFPVARWTPVHVLVWEAAHGPVPQGHIVRFRDGMKTLIAREITADRLELVTLAENMRRNSLHRWPADLKQLVHLKGALNRKINHRSREHEKQDVRRP